MPHGRTTLLVLVLSIVVTADTRGQVYTSADYVRGLYQRYLAREPSSNELTQWVWSFQKGLPAVEAQVTFLSSDEYFQRHARNPELFVVGLFGEVLSRTPSANETAQWVRYLQGLSGDRAALVRTFLQESQREAARPAESTSPAQSAAEGEIAATARLLRDALNHELGGTQQGRQVLVMATNLVTAARTLEQAGGEGSAGYSRARDDMNRALVALETALQPLKSSAPLTGVYLARLRKQVAPPPSVSSQLASLPQPATTSVADVDAQRYAELLRTSTGLSAETQQILFQLRSILNRDAYQNQLLRDVEWFHSHADTFHRSLRVGLPLTEARASVARMRCAAEGVSQSVRQGNPAGKILQRWDTVSRDLQQISSLVGSPSGPAIDPGQPVLINAPTYVQLPYQVQRPIPAQNVDQLTPTIDQAIGHLNAFVVSLGRLMSQSARVPGLQAEARGLRLQLIQLRESVSEGMPARQLNARLDEINRSLRALRAQRQEAATLSRLSNFPDLSDVQRSVDRLNQIFSPTVARAG